eukprot:3940378-Rhodomonas_salina.2
MSGLNWHMVLLCYARATRCPDKLLGQKPRDPEEDEIQVYLPPASYALSGTDIAYGAMRLCAGYAMSGTGIGPSSLHFRYTMVLKWSTELYSPALAVWFPVLLLLFCYALSGTDLTYGATRICSGGTHVTWKCYAATQGTTTSSTRPIVLRASYGMSGTGTLYHHQCGTTDACAVPLLLRRNQTQQA